MPLSHTLRTWNAVQEKLTKVVDRRTPPANSGTPDRTSELSIVRSCGMRLRGASGGEGRVGKKSESKGVRSISRTIPEGGRGVARVGEDRARLHEERGQHFANNIAGSGGGRGHCDGGNTAGGEGISGDHAARATAVGGKRYRRGPYHKNQYSRGSVTPPVPFRPSPFPSRGTWTHLPIHLRLRIIPIRK
jgi:hypothetical protein